MNRNDIFKHYKGGQYKFIGISIPLNNSTVNIHLTSLKRAGTAKREDTLEDTFLYEVTGISGDNNSGLIATETEIPYVIYQSQETDIIWARRVDDFFDFTYNEASEPVKRFTLI